MTFRSPRARRALSLLQLLVALGLALALLGAVFLFLHDLVDSRERALERSRREDAVAALFERLESDLALSIAGASSVGSGVVGDAHSLTILTRVVQPSAVDARRGLLDLHRHEYRHDAVAQAVVGSRGLVRGGAETIVFDGRVAALRFRYHDGREWTDTFDSRAAGGLPAAVEVAVWFDLPEALLPRADADVDVFSGDEEASAEGRGADTAIADAGAIGETSASDATLPAPDRLRVIAIPDGGVPERAVGAPTTGSEAPTEPETLAPEGAAWSLLAMCVVSNGRERRRRGHRRRTPSAALQPAFVLLTMLVILAIAISVVAGMVMLARGDAAIAVTHERNAQSRALAWSGVQALGVTLEGQRQQLMVGEAPQVDGQMVIYEAPDALGVVRLLPIGLDARGDASRLRAEGGLVDLNRVDAVGLAATGLVDTAQAEAIVSARAAAGGRFLSESELIGVGGLSPEQVYGSLEALAWAADAGRPLQPGGPDAVAEVPTPYSAETFGVQAAARGLLDAVTVFSVEPLLRGDGRPKVSLAQGWSEEIGKTLESELGEELAAALEGMVTAGVPGSDAALVKLLRQRNAPVGEWRRVLDAVTVHPGPWLGGRVDLGTAPYEAILATPGITPQQAAEIVRQRDDLAPDDRLSPTWLMSRGIVQADLFESLVDRVTTRCFLWRARLAAGEVSPDDPDGPLSNAVVWEVVIDLSGPRWRLAYLRDASLLPLAAALVLAEPEEEEEEAKGPSADAASQAPAGVADDGVDAGEGEEEGTPDAEAPPEERMNEPEKPAITAPTRGWSGGADAPASPPAPKGAPAPKAPSGPPPVGRWRTE